MKKLLFILFVLLTYVGCNTIPNRNEYTNKEENAEFGWNYIDKRVKFRRVIIDEHQYILFMTTHCGGYGSPIITVVHSESCPCKNKKK